MSYLFGNEASIHVGDPYKDHPEKRKPKKKEAKKFKGSRQFLTNPTKKGTVGSGVYFSSYEYKSEKYKDVKDKKKKDDKKKLTTAPFKFTSPPSKPSGSGSYFGCIGGKFEHMQEYEVVKKGDVRKKAEIQTKKNIVTNPPKKGTYGYVGTTLQKEIYKTDVDVKKLKKEEEEKPKKKKKKITVPFKSATKGGPFFTDNKDVYCVPDKILKEMRSEAKTLKTEPKKKTEKKSFTPWKPSQPKRGAIGKHPEHVTDPYDKKEKRKKGEEKQRPIFKPCNVSKTGPTRSIIFSKFK